MKVLSKLNKIEKTLAKLMNSQKPQIIKFRMNLRRDGCPLDDENQCPLLKKIPDTIVTGSKSKAKPVYLIFCDEHCPIGEGGMVNSFKFKK